MKRLGHHLKLLFSDKKPSQYQTKQLCRGFCQGTKVVSPNQDDFAMISPRIKLRDGRHLAYLERGVSKDVAKYKIIIVHGFGSSKEMNFLASQELIDELGIYLLQYDRAGVRATVLCHWSLNGFICYMELPSVLTPQQRKKKNNSSMAQTLAMPIAPSLALISNPRPLSRAVYFLVLNPPKVRELSIECARVGGVEIPNKRIEFSLQYIHGIGRSRARKILCDISMDNKITKDLSEEDLITLRDEVSKYVIEGDLIGTFAEEGKQNINAMRCRSRTHHLLYQRQALRIFQRSLCSSSCFSKSIFMEYGLNQNEEARTELRAVDAWILTDKPYSHQSIHSMGMMDDDLLLMVRSGVCSGGGGTTRFVVMELSFRFHDGNCEVIQWLRQITTCSKYGDLLYVWGRNSNVKSLCL
ncbi:hypothetical protein HN873_048703 [Arachis hypogaea]